MSDTIKFLDTAKAIDTKRGQIANYLKSEQTNRDQETAAREAREALQTEVYDLSTAAINEFFEIQSQYAPEPEPEPAPAPVPDPVVDAPATDPAVDAAPAPETATEGTATDAPAADAPATADPATPVPAPVA